MPVASTATSAVLVTAVVVLVVVLVVVFVTTAAAAVMMLLLGGPVALRVVTGDCQLLAGALAARLRLCLLLSSRFRHVVVL